MQPTTTTVGVLALQGGFAEHVALVRKAAAQLADAFPTAVEAVEVRTPDELARCDALIIPGGESTTISFVAAQSGLLEPLREFVKCVDPFLPPPPPPPSRSRSCSSGRPA